MSFVAVIFLGFFSLSPFTLISKVLRFAGSVIAFVDVLTLYRILYLETFLIIVMQI